MRKYACPTHIGPFEYDADAGELLALGRTARLEPKAAHVLQVLLQNRGRVVSRQQLFDAVWPGRYVVDASLTRCISQIRAALDDKQSHSYLQTLHKRGYRLVNSSDCCTAWPR